MRDTKQQKTQIQLQNGSTFFLNKKEIKQK